MTLLASERSTMTTWFVSFAFSRLFGQLQLMQEAVIAYMQINLSDCRVRFWKEIDDGCTPSAVSWLLAANSNPLNDVNNLEVLRELFISFELWSIMGTIRKGRTVMGLSPMMYLLLFSRLAVDVWYPALTYSAVWGTRVVRYSIGYRMGYREEGVLIVLVGDRWGGEGTWRWKWGALIWSEL